MDATLESQRVGPHVELFTGINPMEMSAYMHSIGQTLGKTTFELGLIGYGDNSPIRIHTESIYHEQLCTYFMLGCIKQADIGGENIIYDASRAAQIILSEAPELHQTVMTYHAEHYQNTKSTVPLLRIFDDEPVLCFRQDNPYNEIAVLPDGWSELELYEYIDSVLNRSTEFEHRLQPGEFLVVDNYKTLHVRTAYQGLRKIIRVRVDDPAYVSIEK